ncbi:Insulin-like growth factor 2 mRNA-binding protein 1, partial [Aphis craccivora]
MTDMSLKILIHNNLIDIIIGGEGNTIRKIMSETNTDIFIPSITDITMDWFNYERICTIKGSIENICKAQAQISAKISQRFEKMSHYKLIRVKPEITNKKYKLLIVGQSNVGKSSIIKRYCQEVYQNTNQPTIGMDIHQIFIRFKNETIHLENRDMAGTEKYCTLENSYRGVHGIYIVYDITNLNSLIKLDGWIKHIETVIIVLKCVSILFKEQFFF